jgi:hypothetical protein
VGRPPRAIHNASNEANEVSGGTDSNQPRRCKHAHTLAGGSAIRPAALAAPAAPPSLTQHGTCARGTGPSLDARCVHAVCSFRYVGRRQRDGDAKAELQRAAEAHALLAAELKVRHEVGRIQYSQYHVPYSNQHNVFQELAVMAHVGCRRRVALD